MRHFVALPVVILVAASTYAQSVRDHTRLTPTRPTRVTEAQATELTLTVTPAAVRPIQIWVRTAATLAEGGLALTADVPAGQAAPIRVGQRVRAFSPESRSRMHQANVSGVVRRGTHVSVQAMLTARPLEESRHFVLEVVTEERNVLSVPNDAIIDTGGRTVVYVRGPDGGFSPREIMQGVQGELFTEVLTGLESGESVVTIGSFFIDAEHKLKGP